jgi:hypothetical protein
MQNLCMCGLSEKMNIGKFSVRIVVLRKYITCVNHFNKAKHVA